MGAVAPRVSVFLARSACSKGIYFPGPGPDAQVRLPSLEPREPPLCCHESYQWQLHAGKLASGVGGRGNIFAKFGRENQAQVAVSTTVFRWTMDLDDVVQALGSQAPKEHRQMLQARPVVRRVLQAGDRLPRPARIRWGYGFAAQAGAWLLMAVAMSCARRAPSAPVSPSTVGASVPAELSQRFTGTYVYAGGDDERADVARAVDRAVEDMSFLTRGIARSALMDRAAIRESYTIFFDEAGRVAVLSPGELPEVSPADGTPVEVVNRLGDESELTQQFIDGVLVQRGRTADGGGSTAFELQPDGEMLLVHRTMESSKLSQPVKYTLTYRRR